MQAREKVKGSSSISWGGNRTTASRPLSKAAWVTVSWWFPPPAEKHAGTRAQMGAEGWRWFNKEESCDSFHKRWMALTDLPGWAHTNFSQWQGARVENCFAFHQNNNKRKRLFLTKTSISLKNFALICSDSLQGTSGARSSQQKKKKRKQVQTAKQNRANRFALVWHPSLCSKYKVKLVKSTLGLKTPDWILQQITKCSSLSAEIITLFNTTEQYSANNIQPNYLDKNHPHLLRRLREKNILQRETILKLSPAHAYWPTESLAMSSSSVEKNVYESKNKAALAGQNPYLKFLELLFDNVHFSSHNTLCIQPFLRLAK